MSYRDDEDVVGGFPEEEDEFSGDLGDELDLDDEFAVDEIGFGEEEEETF